MGKVVRLERRVTAWWLWVNVGQLSKGKGEHMKRGGDRERASNYLHQHEAECEVFIPMHKAIQTMLL